MTADAPPDHRRHAMLLQCTNGLAVLLVRNLDFTQPDAREQAREILVWLDHAGTLIRRALGETATEHAFGNPIERDADTSA